MIKSSPPILIIAGPTGVGKSEAAVIVAEELAGEIISADSRQVYRGVVIGTAAPGSELQKRIPHHLVNVRDPRETWSAGDFAEEAARCITGILKRKKQPIVVGGSGFYIRALTEGLFEASPVDKSAKRRVRDRLRRRLQKEGSHALYEDLLTKDPEWARSIAETDSQRVLRGLEIYELHGVPLSELQRAGETGPPVEATWCTVLLEREREDLYRRINARVEKLLDSGWLGEARSLKSAGIPMEAPGLSGLGYDLLFQHLQGSLSYDDTVNRISQEHRNYAKRQMTWFRSLTAERIFLNREDGPEEAAARILQVW